MEEKVASERLESQAGIIRIDEKQAKDHLGEMVRGTVEDTLNRMLETEADMLCGATRYELNFLGPMRCILADRRNAVSFVPA